MDPIETIIALKLAAQEGNWAAVGTIVSALEDLFGAQDVEEFLALTGCQDADEVAWRFIEEDAGDEPTLAPYDSGVTLTPDDFPFLWRCEAANG